MNADIYFKGSRTSLKLLKSIVSSKKSQSDFQVKEEASRKLKVRFKSSHWKDKRFDSPPRCDSGRLLFTHTHTHLLARKYLRINSLVFFAISEKRLILY